MYMRAIFIMCLIWVHMCTSAQIKYGVGAIIETQNHLWILDSLSRDRECIMLLWRVKDKGNAKRFAVPNNLILKDNDKGRSFSPTIITPSKYKTRKFESIQLKMVFPAIGDSSTCISLYSSPTFYLDSLNIPAVSSYMVFSGEIRWFSEPRYHVPLFPNQHLITRKDSIEYSDSLFLKGVSYYKKKEYDRAIICFEKCYNFDKILDDYNWLFSALKREYNDYSKMWLAHCHYKLGNIQYARIYDEDYKLEPYDRNCVKECDSIYNYVNSFAYKPSSEDDEIGEYKKMCTLDSLVFGIKHHRYVLSLYELGQKYASYRNLNKSLVTFQEAYDIIAKIDKESSLAKTIIEEIAKVEYEKGDIESAIEYMKKCLDIQNEDDIDYHRDYPILSRYEKLADYYAEVGSWEKALLIKKQRVEFWENRSHESPIYRDNYISAVKSFATTLSNSGRSKEAIRILKSIIGMDDLRKYELMDLGFYFFELGDYESTNKYYQEALNDSSDILWESHQNQLAIYYTAIGDYNKALTTQKALIDSINPQRLSYSTLYNSYGSYATYLSNLSYIYNLIEQYDSALIWENKSLEIKKQYTAPNSDDIAYSHLNIGKALGGKGLWNDAIKHTLLGYNVFKQKKQKKFYNRSLSYLSQYAFEIHDYERLVRYLKELLLSVNEDLISTLQELTYNERSRYIEFYSDLLTHQIPRYAYYVQHDSLTSMAYDATLLIKGALLNSENSVKRLIEESKDEQLKKLWEKLRINRYLLKQVQEKKSFEKRCNEDSLYAIINSIEDSIIVRCKEYGDITHNMQMKWGNIQAALNSDDIAIEFLSFPVNKDSVLYIALTLRNDYKYPKLTTLFEEKQLKAVKDTVYFHSSEISELVWRKLLPELKNVKNIYFSPSGMLYNMPIEYLPEMENYNFCRLSSTRELASNKRSIPGYNAVLYGGIDYYAQLDTLSTKNSIFTLGEMFGNHAEVRGMKIRGGKEFLPQTMMEIKQIGEVLNKARWSCVLDTMSLASEESFKSFSGKVINVIHIATHGFYYTSDEANSINYDFLMLNNNMASVEDKSLTRSGLLMAGANHILEGENLPDNVEDGILTAKEISDVDLRGLDLVVLSACQTGLGDISQGEGVFGLQRGFKKAGANAILMSLWEVDDKATQILMTQFYKNLLSGQSKRHSLQAAQKYLREYNNGFFNEPKYWAAFILLDGIK